MLEVEVQEADEPREVQKAQGEIDQHEAVGLETMPMPSRGCQSAQPTAQQPVQ